MDKFNSKEWWRIIVTLGDGGRPHLLASIPCHLRREQPCKYFVVVASPKVEGYFDDDDEHDS